MLSLKQVLLHSLPGQVNVVCAVRPFHHSSLVRECLVHDCIDSLLPQLHHGRISFTLSNAIDSFLRIDFELGLPQSRRRRKQSLRYV